MYLVLSSGVGVVVVELPQMSEDDLRCARAAHGRPMR